MLTDEQKQSIFQWISDGATLSQVQTRIKSEFGISMTFLDVRLLVNDIGATLSSPAPQEKPKNDSTAEEATATPNDSAAPPLVDESGEPVVPAGTVSMELNAVAIPGTMVSGSVTFSDGMHAKWSIDQMGRFQLEPDQLGYRPSDEDLQEFQLQLREALQRKGMI